MDTELSYVLVTPYTIAKSRTGGVIARLLSQLDLELAGAQMLAPDEAFTRDYARLLREQNRPNEVTLLADYVEQNLFLGGKSRPTLLLLFRGREACAQLTRVCGVIHGEHRGLDSLTGETIRDTYADLITDPGNPERVTYFEPAVLTPRNQKEAGQDLALFARFLKGRENIPAGPGQERTLVILKPDNWTYASSKPGTIIDMFSRTGLRMVGVKVHQFSLEEALEFYGPVEEALKEKLAPVFGEKAAELLEREFKVTLSDEARRILAAGFGVEYAQSQFRDIVEFMSGRRPGASPGAGGSAETGGPAGIKPVKTMILVYEGEGAVQKIRKVLGPTDPLKAPGGTIRREFGSNVMVNTAHASDSTESFNREQGIVKIRENNLGKIIEDYAAGKGPN